MSRTRRALRFAPGGVGAVLLVVATTGAGVPWWQAAGYLLGFAWSVVLPGVIVHRRLRGATGLLVADLALGGATGLVLQLAAWAAFTAVGLGHLLALWPLAVVLPFVTRKLLTSARRAPGGSARPCGAVDRMPARAAATRVPAGAAWLGVLAFALLLLPLVTSTFPATALPPAAGHWYQDLYWHLGLSAELLTHVPPEVDQVAGRPLAYHWFADAHIAAMTHTTGLDLATVLGRLWMPPVLALVVGGAVAVGHRLSGSAWPGAVAALTLAVGARVQPAWFSLPGFSVSVPFSPSQQFSLPLALLALQCLVDLVRGVRLGGGGAALLAATLLACTGAKSSMLPVLLGGVGLALVVALVRHRGRIGRLALVAGLMALAVLVTKPFLAGGGSGAGLQLFSTVRATAPWVALTGHGYATPSRGLVLPGLGAEGAVALLVLVLLAYAVGYGWLLAAAPLLRGRDLAPWLLLGTGLAGLGALLLINHSGLSQVYFMAGALPAWHLLAGWGLHRSVVSARESVQRARAAGTTASGVTEGPARWRRPVLTTAFLGAGIGALGVLGSRRLAGPAPDAGALTEALARGLALPAAAGLLVAGLALAARRFGRRRADGTAARVTGQAGPAARSRAWPALAWLLVVWAVLAAGLVAPGAAVASRVGAARSAIAATLHGAAPGTGAPAGSDPGVVTVDETAAARWLREHAGRDDIVATNVHCLGTRTTPHCDARAFWVSGLTERRVLVGGWGYTDEAQAANGVGGRRYPNQPFDDPELFALNEAAFTAPSAAGLRRLSERGVRWLYADRTAGPVSPALARLATVAFEQGPVTVLRLH